MKLPKLTGWLTLLALAAAPFAYAQGAVLPGVTVIATSPALKTPPLTNRMRLRLYFDAFNLTNSYASKTISRATGLSYQKPSAILAPRTARVGFRFIF